MSLAPKGLGMPLHPTVSSRLFACWLAWGAASTAWAQTGGGDPRTRARELVAQADQARTASDSAQAEKRLEQALRLASIPEITLALGRLAEQDGRVVAAADLYRRYLDEVGDAADKDTRSKLLAFQQSIKDPVAEVDILGPSGSLLYVDDHLAGMLPLSGPMLLEARSHRFRLVVRQSTYQSDPLDLLPSMRAQLHLTPGTSGTAVAILSLSSEWLLLIEPTDMQPEQKSLVEQSIAGLAKRERATLISTAKLERALKSKPTDCLHDPACQEAVARQLGTRAVVRVHVDRAAGKLRAEWYDVDGGGVAAVRERPCGTCQDKAMRDAASALSIELLREAQNHPRGVLDLSSSPAGAQVVIDGTVRGVTPYQRALLEGRHDIKLRHDGYADYDQTIALARGQTLTISAALTPGKGTPLGPQPGLLGEQKPRPVWRYLLGGGLIASGLLLSGFGLSALSQFGSCGDTTPPPEGAPCNYIYGTGTVGGGLLGAGLGLTVGGVLTIAWPAK